MKIIEKSFCQCTEDQTTGWTELPSCNICGKVVEGGQTNLKPVTCTHCGKKFETMLDAEGHRCILFQLKKQLQKEKLINISYLEQLNKLKSL